MANKPDRSEGDINISPLREEWQIKNNDDRINNILEEDSRYFLHQSLSTPCLSALESCKGSYITDAAGKEYLDFHGNNVHQVGYGNEEVINAVIEQLQTLPFSPRRFTNSKAVELAKKLTLLTNNKLSRVLFAPGGAEAVGIALKLARIYTGRFKTISWWGSFHGAGLDTISIGGEAVFRQGMGPLLPGAYHVPPPSGKNGGAKYLESAEYIGYIMEQEGDIGAFIAEPIRYTEAIFPPKEYWLKIRELCDKHGVLLIFDEIPTCLGRTGYMFAHEYYGVTPDILCIGKGLGGGVFPMAAVIAKEELNVAGNSALGHYTHEKSPVGSAAALATIKYIEENNLCNKASVKGAELTDWLKSLSKKFDFVGETRGQGYLIGTDIIVPGDNYKGDPERAEKILYNALSLGLSFKISGGSTLTLMPPLTISDMETEKFKTILYKALQMAR